MGFRLYDSSGQYEVGASNLDVVQRRLKHTDLCFPDTEYAQELIDLLAPEEYDTEYHFKNEKDEGWVFWYCDDDATWNVVPLDPEDEAYNCPCSE